MPALAVAALSGWWWWLIGRQVPRLGYAEQDDDLLVRRGIMWRQIVVVPYGRMQYVDVQAGPLDRLLGIARVQLHTASAATDARDPGAHPGGGRATARPAHRPGPGPAGGAVTPADPDTGRPGRPGPPAAADGSGTGCTR